MAFSFGGSGQSINRTTNLPTTAAFTWAAWVRVRSVRASNYQYFFAFENAASNASAYAVLGYHANGDFDFVTDQGSMVATAPTVGAWTFMAVTLAGAGAGNCKYYHAKPNASSFTTGAIAGTTFTPAQLILANDSYNEWCNVDIAHAMVWRAVLSEQELRRQLYNPGRPQRWDSLYLWTPLAATGDTRDASGNGNHWTVNGTVANTENPPLAPGRVWFVPWAVPSGSSPISGAAAITLGNLTTAAAGTVEVRGAAAITLGGLTTGATGAVGSAPISGAAAIALGSLTTAAAGTVAAAGSAAITLGALTTSAAGKVAISGAAAITLGALTTTASAQHLGGVCTGGVLRVNATNGRYFETDAGPLVLAGFHTWADIQDSWPTTPITAFDFNEYLDALVSYGCNFTKAWFLESTRNWGDSSQYFSPHPWPRTGPGNAADGLLKFNLSQFNQTYFDRLRERVIRLGNEGIYVCIQLFQGWHIALKAGTDDPWPYHPFAIANNINSIDGDANDNGNGYEIRSTTFTAVYNLQKAYVEKVIDTLNDLDHIFYEIANEEDPGSSLTWQRALVAHIKSYESGKPKQHPVGMTVGWPGGNNSDLYASDVEWLSPNGDYTPDAASTDAVSAFDSDHITGLTAEYKWIWRALCQGHNPWYMDEWAGETYGSDRRNNATYQRIRANLGWAVTRSAQIDLANATPQGGLASTGYCLAKTTGIAQILAYQDTSGNFTVNLTGINGTFSLVWLRTAATSPTTAAGSNVSGGAVRTLSPPWAGEDALAFLELIAIDGAAAITLGALTTSATGTVSVQGAAAITLGELTTGATGTVASTPISGTAAIILDALTTIAAGTVEVLGEASITLGALITTAEGVVGEPPVIGEAAITLDVLTTSAAGTVEVRGVTAVTLDALTTAGTGTVAVAGAAAIILDSLTTSAAGAVAIFGAAAITLDALTADAAGVIGEVDIIEGAAAITLEELTTAATGIVAFLTVFGSITGPGAAGTVRGPKATADRR